MSRSRGLYFLLLGLAVCVVVTGCTAAPSAQDEYDAAVKELNTEQARLDALMPSYLAAKQTATLAVCKELAGVTPDEAQSAALDQLQKSLTGINANAQAAAEKKPGDINAQIDNLLSQQGAMAEQSQALLGSGSKVAEVMQNIKTPGTPEAKRFDDVFNAIPEVQAYQRQEQRLAKAKQAVLEAEAKLPDHAASPAPGSNAKPADAPSTTPPTTK